MSNQRAVAEVIGALLMIALAVTGGVIVYVYSSGLVGSLSAGKVQQPYSEQISLDYYHWWPNGNLTLEVRNTGSTQVTLADFFIAGNQITPNATVNGCMQPPLNGVVSVNAPACLVKMTYPPAGLAANWGVSYDVRLVTKDGAIFDFTCITATAS